jgi:hypothetical protein
MQWGPVSLHLYQSLEGECRLRVSATSAVNVKCRTAVTLAYLFYQQHVIVVPFNYPADAPWGLLQGGGKTKPCVLQSGVSQDEHLQAQPSMWQPTPDRNRNGASTVYVSEDAAARQAEPQHAGKANHAVPRSTADAESTELYLSRGSASFAESIPASESSEVITITTPELAR